MTDTTRSPWLKRFHSSPAPSVRLVCLPHAGGSASFYFPMSQALAPAVEVVGVQYPGRQDRFRDPLVTSIGEYADHVVTALGDRSDVPLALFGHSMGAVIAFEVANRLRAEGRAPVALFASGRRAPSRTRVETVHQRSDDGLLNELRVLGGTESPLLGDNELTRMILPAVRGDFQAVETYRHLPTEPLDVPIHVLTGDVDPRVTADEARAWQDHTSSTFALDTFAGGHFFLVDHQREIVDIVSSRLAPR